MQGAYFLPELIEGDAQGEAGSHRGKNVSSVEDRADRVSPEAGIGDGYELNACLKDYLSEAMSMLGWRATFNVK
jgi:hypothetical protein